MELKNNRINMYNSDPIATMSKKKITKESGGAIFQSKPSAEVMNGCG